MYQGTERADRMITPAIRVENHLNSPANPHTEPGGFGNDNFHVTPQ